MNPGHLIILLAFCVLNVLPLFIQEIGGDSYIHLSSIHCFATQFWRGDIMPRWCFEGDAATGSPVFLFYPPLPYVISSLIYPIHWIGVTVYAVYAIAVTLCTLLTGFACYKWLERAAGPNAALVGSLIYLFLPYRMEVMVGRSGFGELWVLAFAPLMALAVREMIRGRGAATLWFVLWTALALLSQPAVALCILIALGVHVLAQGGVGLWLRFALACAAAVALTFFYTLPALHYIPFVDQARVHTEAPTWANRFVYPIDDWQQGRAGYIIGLAFSIIGYLWLTRLTLRRKRRINHMPDRNETVDWAVAGGIAIVMLFPISKPLWMLINMVAPIGFPWRMQSVMMLSIVYMMAMYVRWLISGRRRITARGDFLTLMLFLICIEVYNTSTIAVKDRPDFERLLAARIVSLREYRTIWTSPEYHDSNEAIRRAEAIDTPALIDVLRGPAMVYTQQWNWHGIVFTSNAMREDAVVRVEHRYFPIWQATADYTTPVQMQPEKDTGFMLLKLPPGRHTIIIKPESRWSSFLGRGAQNVPEALSLEGGAPLSWGQKRTKEPLGPPIPAPAPVKPVVKTAPPPVDEEEEKDDEDSGEEKDENSSAKPSQYPY